MINKALDFLRLKKEQLSLEEAGEIGEMIEEEAELVEYKYTADTIKKAIYALPEGYRLVLSLILLEGYDHEEVSIILNISNATSRTQYHRAKKRLIELLKNSEEDHD
jgi:RNA polymerase sigma-70 factor (ECF subfamily)